MIDSLVAKHGAMTMRRVRTQTRVNPQAQTVSKLPANFRNGLAGGIVSKSALLLFSRHWKKQELSDAGGEILFDLLQSRRDVVTNIAAQTGYGLLALQPFHHKKGLNQLRAVEFRLGAQIAQVLRSSQTHETLDHRDISSNYV